MLRFFAAIAAYLIGGIPFGFIIAHCSAGVDIRRQGSGNIGATNVGRTLGLPFFFLVFLLDFLKGALPVLAALWILETQAGPPGSPTRQALLGLPEFVGIAAIVGHIYPVYLSFRGGKGVATTIGVLMVLAPWPCLIGLAVWFAVVLISGFVSLGSILFAVVFTIAHFATTSRPFEPANIPMAVFAGVICSLIILRHIENISRLVNGTEPPIAMPWHKRRKPTSQDPSDESA